MINNIKKKLLELQNEEYKNFNKKLCPDTNLKMKRKSVGLSQSELAILTEIPVRTIQQYEQRQKDINKASMEYMYKLSKVLACEPKELMEFVTNK